MDPVTGTIIAGLGGSLLSGLFGSSAQKKANKTNIQLQQKQLDWQERMANTEWQRGVQDMKAAGMNPMLAFSQGGASTPNVSAAQVIPEDAWSKAAHTAGQTAMQTLALKQMEANIELTRANASKATAEAQTAGVTSSNAAARQSAELANIRAEYRRILEAEDLTRAQRQQIEELLPQLIKQQQETLRLTEAQTTTARAEGKLKEHAIPSARAEAEMWSDLSKGVGADTWLKLILAIRSLIR